MLGSLYMTHMLKGPKYYIEEGSRSAHSPTLRVGLPDIGSLFLIVIPRATGKSGKSLHVAVSSIVSSFRRQLLEQSSITRYMHTVARDISSASQDISLPLSYPDLIV